MKILITISSDAMDLEADGTNLSKHTWFTWKGKEREIQGVLEKEDLKTKNPRIGILLPFEPFALEEVEDNKCEIVLPKPGYKKRGIRIENAQVKQLIKPNLATKEGKWSSARIRKLLKENTAGKGNGVYRDRNPMAKVSPHMDRSFKNI